MVVEWFRVIPTAPVAPVVRVSGHMKFERGGMVVKVLDSTFLPFEYRMCCYFLLPTFSRFLSATVAFLLIFFFSIFFPSFPFSSPACSVHFILSRRSVSLNFYSFSSSPTTVLVI